MKDGDKIKWVYLKNNPLGLDSVGMTGIQRPEGNFRFSKRIY